MVSPFLGLPISYRAEKAVRSGMPRGPSFRSRLCGFSSLTNCATKPSGMEKYSWIGDSSLKDSCVVRPYQLQNLIMYLNRCPVCNPLLSCVSGALSFKIKIPLYLLKITDTFLRTILLSNGVTVPSSHIRKLNFRTISRTYYQEKQSCYP